jgi:hypothetical protein
LQLLFSCRQSEQLVLTGRAMQLIVLVIWLLGLDASAAQLLLLAVL